MGFFDKIKKLNIFSGFSAIDDDFYDELEETLILSDMGMDTTLKAVEELKSRVKGEKIKDEEGVRACLRRVLQDMLAVGDQGLKLDTKPSVVLFIGVNGVGKTTTIGKLGASLKGEGKKVLLCAGTPSGPPPRNSSPSGHSAPARRSSSSMREPTLPPWSSTR